MIGRMAWGLYRAMRMVLAPSLNEDDRAEMDDLVDARVRAADGRRAGVVFVWVFELLDLFRVWRTRWRAPRLGISWLDVKLGLRMLVKHPGLTSVSVISLAVGIPMGLTPSHISQSLTAPLPVEDGDRIMGLRYRRGGATTFYDFMALRGQLNAFQELGALRTVEYNLDPGTGSSLPLCGIELTTSTFSILRAQPHLGRMLNVADEVLGAPDVVVLGHEVWQVRLAGDPEVVGSIVRIGGVPHTVVGVMPADFLFPRQQQMWLPLRERPAEEPDGSPNLQIYGRLSDGATEEEAQAELTASVARMALRFPERYERVRAEVLPYTSQFFELPIEVWAVFQTFMVVLLAVACANVGILIFARTATRSAELALRTALGASRWRIVGQVFAEALVLAVIAAGVGLLLIDTLANYLLTAMWSPDFGGLPYWIDMGVTRSTIFLALLLAVCSAALAAVVPALRVTGKGFKQHFQHAGAGHESVRFGGISGALIVADVAIAVAVVGLAVGFANRMGEMVEGRGLEEFPAEEYLAVRLRLPEVPSLAESDTFEGSGSDNRQAAVQRALVERLQAEPGVQGVAVASELPRMDHPRRRVEVEDRSPGDIAAGYHMIRRARVAPGFFDALDRPILSGRSFNSGDLVEDQVTVIVNTTFAEKALGSQNPVGQRLRYIPFGRGEPSQWYEIVGMVADFGMDILSPNDDAGIYHPVSLGEIDPVRLAVHVGPDPMSFTPRLRELAGQVAPTVTISQPMALDTAFPDDWYLMIGTVVGQVFLLGVLLALATSSIFAIMAFGVAQRTREIGIRAALGAQPGNIAAAIGRRAAAQLAIGGFVGMPLAGWLYVQAVGGGAGTHTVFVAAVVPGVGVLLLVGLLACTVPLRRALRIMPTEAMREGA